MGLVVCHPELFPNDFGNASTGPQLPAKAVCLSPVRQQIRDYSKRRCSSVSLAGRCPWGFERHASASDAWELSHWLTAPLVTPNASAMSHCLYPFASSSLARLRRISFQSLKTLLCLMPQFWHRHKSLATYATVNRIVGLNYVDIWCDLRRRTDGQFCRN
jgi:hypothetical protein